MFLLYVAVLALAIWSLVALLLGIDGARVQACITNSLPVRTIAAYLVATTVFFALTWLRDILPGLVHLSTPASLQGTLMLTNPIQVMDFAVGFPVTILAAVWLWQRRPWGYVLAGLFLGIWRHRGAQRCHWSDFRPHQRPHAVDRYGASLCRAGCDCGGAVGAVSACHSPVAP